MPKREYLNEFGNGEYQRMFLSIDISIMEDGFEIGKIHDYLEYV